MDLSEPELYCIAKVIQSIMFSPNGGMFYGCKYCKYQEICMPDKKPHKDMIFDKVRTNLQDITAVDLGFFFDGDYADDKFKDNHQ